ncbi:MAG TPA: MarR family transcriptional regulator [Acidimicrobiales bacterium]|nr:MarR family transcriptional regulator [Acidimicrobiales bacterium]
MTRHQPRPAEPLSTLAPAIAATKRQSSALRQERLDRVEDALTHLNRIINGRAADRVRMERSGIPISKPLMMVLRALYEHGPMGVVELGELNHMDKGYVSRSWRSLQASGYISASESDDQRTTTLHLTPDGRDVYRRWRRANAAIVGQALREWEDDDLENLVIHVERLLSSFAQTPKTTAPEVAVMLDKVNDLT